MLGLIAVIGLFPQSDEIKAGVEKVLVVAFPPSEQAGMLRSLQHAKTSAGTLALVSLLALLWSGTNLFASMEFALSQIYLCAVRPFWRTRLMGLAMLMTAVLVVIYRFVPNRRIRLSQVWPGALVAGLSFELLNLAFPIYVQLTRGATAYGRSFGFLFVLGTWTYLLSVVLLLGAVMNRMRLDRGHLEAKDQ
jgi:uncharacterized BrkB/YihY/UPF0761 family membrane protein